MPLVDLPPGFIDIHCHLLHGVDDGPATLELAVRMCGLAHASGTVAVVSTPHANHRYAFDAAKAAERRRELEQSLPHPLHLFGGCEMQLNPELLTAALGHWPLYTINASRYLLMELMPAGMSPNLDRVFDRLLQRGVTPVLAHPERNPQLQCPFDHLAAWVEQGCLVQITADAVTGRTGRRVQDAAIGLLRERLVHFVASDAHDPIRRPPRLLDAYRVVCEMVAPSLADLLFIHNPRSALENEPIRAYPAY